VVIETLPWLPRPPDWRLDWDVVRAACPWLAPLAATPQNPTYHGEGDVLVHTGMVVQALAAQPAWRALPAHDRAVLFVAALLHDIGKPATTVTELDGRITSRSHARVGAGLARMLLWIDEGLGAPLPFAVRERVVSLVRLHGLPLWFLDRPDLERTLLAASYQTRLNHLALLAEADVRGRIAPDQNELLTRVDLFRSACAEYNCLDQPYPFADDHSRVRYFRSAQGDPTFRAYDDTWGEVVVLCGLPGVGKDTWARAYGAGLPVIALDDIRKRLRVAPEGDQGAVIGAAKEQAREYLRAKQPFIWNATNLTRHLRDPLVGLLLDYRARVRLVYLDAPLERVLERNEQRAATVPRAVLLRLAGKVEPPDRTEAHDVVLTEHSAENERE
jgi:putative nucleotidyltransferase with HDIG domain